MEKNTKLKNLYEELSQLLMKQKDLKERTQSLKKQTQNPLPSYASIIPNNYDQSLLMTHLTYKELDKEFHKLTRLINQKIDEIKSLEKQEENDFSNIEEKIPYIELLYGETKENHKR